MHQLRTVVIMSVHSQSCDDSRDEGGSNAGGDTTSGRYHAGIDAVCAGTADLSRYSARAQRTAKAWIYKHGGWMKRDDKLAALCPFCEKEVLCKNNTTNLYSHLKRAHPEEHERAMVACKDGDHGTPTIAQAFAGKTIPTCRSSLLECRSKSAECSMCRRLRHEVHFGTPSPPLLLLLLNDLAIQQYTYVYSRH